GGLYASPAMQGSRSGAPMAAAWAVMQLLGVEGYTELTRITVDAARRLAEGVRAIDGLAVVGEPEAHLLAIRAADPADLDVFAVDDTLRRRGWHLDRQQRPDSLHATVSAGNAAVIDELLTDLAASVDETQGHRAEDRGTGYSTVDWRDG
ncbi:MAG: hypothetical protein ACE5GB_11345, partial [Acidimicrobiales bacterium]